MPRSTLATLAVALVLPVLAALPAIAQNEDPIAARVDGLELKRSDIERELSSLPPEYQNMPIEALFDALRDRAIDFALLSSEADRLDYREDPEVQAAIADAERVVLRNRLIAATAAAAADDDALAAAYEARRASPDFAYDEVQARHILVDSADEATGLIEELDAGADFAALAETHSTGPSSVDGGDLGYFRREQMVEPFAEVAFAMAPGEYTEAPVETQFGWHVILVEDRRTVSPSLDELRPELEEELGREAVTQLLDDLRTRAEIERFGIDGQPLPSTE